MGRKVLAIAAGIMLAGLFAMVVFSVVASAADVSGTWTGTCTRTSPYASTENAELSIDSSGDGTLAMAGRSYAVSGSVSGSTYYMHTQFDWDGVSYPTCDVDFTVSGDSMTGSGSFVNVGTTIYLEFDLTRGAFGGLGLTITPAAAAVGGLAVLSGLVGLGASIMKAPVDQGARQGPTFLAPQHAHQAPNQYQGGRYNQPPSYQQGAVSETNPNYNPNTPPDVGTSIGGVGMTTPNLLDQNNNPHPPRKYDSPNQPQCPIHRVPCQARFPYQNQLEPGSWYCQRCYDENRSYWDGNRVYTGDCDRGYPWGSYRP
jgi:hypothetical protein